jgi:dTDP-4-dehydrorhamnose reductase
MLGRMVFDVLRGVPSLKVDGTDRLPASRSANFNCEDGPEAVRMLLRRTGDYRYVVNCIGMTRPNIDEGDPCSVRRAEIVNAVFPHQLAAEAKLVGARVIHISTDGVFPEQAGVCYEYNHTRPSDVYGGTKLRGELSDLHTLTLRCSIVGPEPAGRRGLLEWFLTRPDGAEIRGYTDHRWNGVTTLQLAELCRELILGEAFDEVRAESPLHHVCPNEPVSKFQLLGMFRTAFGKNVGIAPSLSPPPAVTRVLGTAHRTLEPLHRDNRGLDRAVERLAQYALAKTAGRHQPE